jgi:hypothetical protein
LWPITDDQFNVRFGSKADVRTAKPHIPYLIAADTSDLPGADVRLPPELEGYLTVASRLRGSIDDAFFRGRGTTILARSANWKSARGKAASGRLLAQRNL